MERFHQYFKSANLLFLLPLRVLVFDLVRGSLEMLVQSLSDKLNSVVFAAALEVMAAARCNPGLTRVYRGETVSIHSWHVKFQSTTVRGSSNIILHLRRGGGALGFCMKSVRRVGGSCTYVI